MINPPCPRENELLDSLGRGFVIPNLREHLQSCPSCSELHLVAGALLEDRTQALGEASVPSASAMWLRLQLRQQHELQAISRHSLMIGQALTLSGALVLIGAMFSTEISSGVRQLVGAIRISTPLLLVLVTWLLLAPIGGWAAIRGK